LNHDAGSTWYTVASSDYAQTARSARSVDRAGARERYVREENGATAAAASTSGAATTTACTHGAVSAARVNGAVVDEVARCDGDDATATTAAAGMVGRIQTRGVAATTAGSAADELRAASADRLTEDRCRSEARHARIRSRRCSGSTSSSDLDSVSAAISSAATE
jgi:hypothetical protein